MWHGIIMIPWCYLVHCTLAGNRSLGFLGVTCAHSPLTRSLISWQWAYAYVLQTIETWCDTLKPFKRQDRLDMSCIFTLLKMWWIYRDITNDHMRDMSQFSTIFITLLDTSYPFPKLTIEALRVLSRSFKSNHLDVAKVPWCVGLFCCWVVGWWKSSQDHQLQTKKVGEGRPIWRLDNGWRRRVDLHAWSTDLGFLVGFYRKKNDEVVHIKRGSRILSMSKHMLTWEIICFTKQDFPYL